MSNQLWLLASAMGGVPATMVLGGCCTIVLMNNIGRSQAFRSAIGYSVCLIMPAISQIGFLGWGLGMPFFDYTGLSGHTARAAYVYPVLFATISKILASEAQRAVAFTLGAITASVVGVSRILIGAHSYSEVISGFLFGLALAWYCAPSKSQQYLRDASNAPILIFTLAMLGSTLVLPPLNTHRMLEKIAIALSGNKCPFYRHESRLHATAL